MHQIKTTVIGSYPVAINAMDYMKDYFDFKESSWNSVIDAAVNDMLDAGIDIISDGQTRDPFVTIFTRKIKGCRIRDRPEVADKLGYAGPIIVDDQKYVKSIIPKKTELIGLIAGPYTLTKSCVDMFYHDEKELAFDFAQVLSKEAKELEKVVDMISVDEPFFSMGIPEYGHDLIKTVIKDLKCETRLHSCGDVSNVVDQLCEIPVDILSHEFKAMPKLFDAFAEHSCSKKICLGSVRSDDSAIESVDEIVNHIKKGLDVFGEKIVQISPDCGLRMQAKDVALKKLKNLVAAGEIINGG